jgi:hypothetical protein
LNDEPIVVLDHDGVNITVTIRGHANATRAEIAREVLAALRAYKESE